MKKLFIMLMVILCLIVVPMTAFAADLPEEEKLGSTKYIGELDTKEIIEIRYVGDNGATLYSDSSYASERIGEVEKDVVLYIENIKDVEENGLTTTWAKVKIDDSGKYSFIKFDDTKAVSSVDSGYVAPVRIVEPTSKGGSSGGSGTGASSGGGSFAITYYCSACNSPRRSNTVALSGSHAFLGSCPANNFPLGSTIYIEGYGTYLVNDRVGRNGVIDIYTGDKDVCTCSGRGRANAYVVG